MTAGMPYGAASPEDAASSLLSWCEDNSVSPIVFGCEEGDRKALAGWSLTEIGRQPLFEASPNFDPELSGQDQPQAHRELRRQARRAFSKGLIVKELTVVDLWLLSQSGALSHMFHNRWKRRALADFSFLVSPILFNAEDDKLIKNDEVKHIKNYYLIKFSIQRFFCRDRLWFLFL